MTNETRIRTCAPGDEHALALVAQATFLETFAGILGGQDIVAHCARAHSVSVYRRWLDDGHYAIWLVESASGGAPVGYMVVAPPELPLPDTAGDLELKRIYLLGAFRGGGVGRQLVSAAIEHARVAAARRLLLGVYAHNRAAIGFYERMGFARLGQRKFTVGGQDYDDIMFGLTLGG